MTWLDSMNKNLLKRLLCLNADGWMSRTEQKHRSARAVSLCVITARSDININKVTETGSAFQGCVSLRS